MSTVQRYTAEDYRDWASGFYPNDGVTARMLLQAAETEARVMELVEAASRLTVKPDGRSYFESGQDTEKFREALSKFRGDA